MSDVVARVAAIVARLEALGTPERKAAFERTAPSAMRGLGVAVPDLRPIAKALSWALRELLEWEPGAVRSFLEAHDAVLAGRVRREVGNKLTTGLKRG